jgi:hypothetical protein
LSSLKTIILLAGLAVALAGFFKVGGLKLSHGIFIGIGLVIAGNLIPDTQQTS